MTDDISNRVGATGEVELGDEHEWIDGHFKNDLKKQRQDHCILLRNKFQMLGILESERSDDDEMEAPIYVFDDDENGRWIKEEAVVDSGAVECVTSRNRVPHLKVEETPGSRRGETWTCAGGREIKMEGKVTVHWTTESGVSKKSVFNVGAVSRTLISVDRLQETGHDVILTQNRPRIINMKTGDVMPLRKNRDVFTLDMWIWIPTSLSKIRRVFGFCEAEVNRLHDTLVSPRSESEDTEGECVKLADDDNGIFTLNVDCGAMGQEMECDAEDQAEQNADRVRTVSDAGQPSKKKARRTRSDARAIQKLVHCACVRGRGVAMKHFRNTSAHKFVMDYCFPSQGSQQGITVLVIKAMKTKVVGVFNVPSKEPSDYLVKVVVDFTSACGCGRPFLKSDGEPSVVALQDALKNVRQSDTNLENSSKGDT